MPSPRPRGAPMWSWKHGTGQGGCSPGGLRNVPTLPIPFRAKDSQMVVVELEGDQVNRGAEHRVGVPVAMNRAAAGSESIEEVSAGLAPDHHRLFLAEQPGIAFITQGVNGNGQVE